MREVRLRVQAEDLSPFPRAIALTSPVFESRQEPKVVPQEVQTNF